MRTRRRVGTRTGSCEGRGADGVRDRTGCALSARLPGRRPRGHRFPPMVTCSTHGPAHIARPSTAGAGRLKVEVGARDWGRDEREEGAKGKGRRRCKMPPPHRGSKYRTKKEYSLTDSTTARWQAVGQWHCLKNLPSQRSSQPAGRARD